MTVKMANVIYLFLFSSYFPRHFLCINGAGFYCPWSTPTNKVSVFITMTEYFIS